MVETTFLGDLRSYLATRVVTWAHAIFVAAVAAIAAWSTPTMLNVILLVVELRLWDDLTDRALDRNVVPRRVIAHTLHSRAFIQLTAALGAINLAIAASLGRGPLLIFTGIHLLLAVIYHPRRQGLEARATVERYLVLGKYPAILALALQSNGHAKFFAASAWLGAMFSAACIYEYLTTPKRSPHALVK